MSDRDELQQIIQERSILKGDFTLVSGKKSTYYINGKMTTLSSKGLYLTAKLLLELLESYDYDAFAGPTIGADPIIGALLTLSADRGLDKEGFLIRKQSKEHGTRKLVEGNIKEGSRVVLLEDVTTTGGSLIRAADAIKEYGGEIICVVTLVDREEGAAENLAEAGFDFKSLFKVKELL
jgi:orotate phosphoribosyltransferase